MTGIFNKKGRQDELPLEAFVEKAIVPRRPVNIRSIGLGLAGVIFICGITPYNDYVLNNTPLVGNYLPIGLLLFFMLVLTVVNAPLRRWAPRLALHQGELAVALAMTLVSCTLPSSGLMRYLPTSLVGLHYQAGQQPAYLSLLQELNLPTWMFPTLQSTDALQRTTDPVITDYWGRAVVDQDTFASHFAAVPWSAWLVPALSWGLLLLALYLALLCLSSIVLRQWADNERLSFPLASVYMALIEEPTAGRAFNALFKARSFWIAFLAVFIIHGLNALSQYTSAVPAIPIRFALRSILSDPPWIYTDWGFANSQLYFTVIGMAYFTQSRMVLSLWLSYLLYEVTRMAYGTHGTEITEVMLEDTRLGSMLVYGSMILWIGLAHWRMVARHMVGVVRPADPPSRYVPYNVAGWGLVLGLAGIIAWLMMAGASFVGALVLVAMAFLLLTVIVRIVAETGLVFTELCLPLARPWVFLLQDLPMALRTTLRSMFFTNYLTNLFVWDVRCSLPVFATHAMRVADGAVPSNESSGRKSISFALCLILALVCGYFVAGAGTLFVEYKYVSTLDSEKQTPINKYSLNEAVTEHTLDRTLAYRPPNRGPIESHNHLKYAGVGAIVTLVIGILGWQFPGFPLHPIGFLMADSYMMRAFWFSLLVGWLAKVLMLRFGGSRFFSAAKPFFLGLIMGEAGATAFWLVVNFAMASTGHSFETFKILPR